MAEYDARMRSAQKEAEEMIAQAKVRAQQMMEENERRMSAEAERIKANAAREIEQERRKALEEVRRYAGELGLRVAERVLERSLTDADHKRLAVDALFLHRHDPFPCELHQAHVHWHSLLLSRRLSSSAGSRFTACVLRRHSF